MTSTSPGLDGQVDAAQDVQLAEPLVDVAADDDVLARARPGASSVASTGPHAVLPVRHAASIIATHAQRGLQTIARLGQA